MVVGLGFLVGFIGFLVGVLVGVVGFMVVGVGVGALVCVISDSAGRIVGPLVG